MRMIVSRSCNNTVLTLSQNMMKVKHEGVYNIKLHQRSKLQNPACMLSLGFHSSRNLYHVNYSCRCGSESNIVPLFYFFILQMQHLCICWAVVMYSCLRSKHLTKISTPGLLARLYREVSLIPHYSKLWNYLFIITNTATKVAHTTFNSPVVLFVSCKRVFAVSTYSSLGQPTPPKKT